MAATTVSTEAALADLDQMFPDYDKTALAAVLEVCCRVLILLLLARVELVTCACVRAFFSVLVRHVLCRGKSNIINIKFRGTAARWLLPKCVHAIYSVVGTEPLWLVNGTSGRTESSHDHCPAVCQLYCCFLQLSDGYGFQQRQSRRKYCNTAQV